MKKVFHLLLIIGLLISIYLTYTHYSSNPYICPIGNNCEKVLTSRYSEIFGIPISLIGAIYFLTTLTFSLLDIKKVVKLMSFAGFLVGLILIYLQFFVLKAVCVYCFVVDIILLTSPLIVVFDKKIINLIKWSSIKK